MTPVLKNRKQIAMSMFDPHAIEQLKTWNLKQNNPIRIEFIQTGHAANDQFAAITHQLGKIAPKLTIEKLTTDSKLPGFRFSENILFCALPLQKELEPFLNGLALLDTPPVNFDNEIKNALDSIDIPVHLKLYIALACPHCPAMVNTLIPLAIYCENIHLEIIDGSLFTENAQADAVLSAPTLILDGGFRWTQDVSSKEIVKMITRRDPSLLSAETLRTILEKGDAEWVTDQMILKGNIFDGFVKLMINDTWSVRLGAMVVVENLCAKNPGLAASLCPKLIELFDQQDITVQGDILYALGESGTAQTVQWIRERLPSISDQDLIDAAQDALEVLESKNMS